MGAEVDNVEVDKGNPKLVYFGILYLCSNNFYLIEFLNFFQRVSGVGSFLCVSLNYFCQVPFCNDCIKKDSAKGSSLGSLMEVLTISKVKAELLPKGKNSSQFKYFLLIFRRKDKSCLGRFELLLS